MTDSASALAVIDEESWRALSAPDRARAAALKHQIASTMDGICVSAQLVQRGFIKLGELVLEVRQKKFWLYWGFKSFGSYIESIEDAAIKRTQLYNAIGAAECLLPRVPDGIKPEEWPAKIEAMGITNASALVRAIKVSGRQPTKEIVQAGIDQPLDEYEATLGDKFRIIEGRPENGRWRHLGGGYYTDEEWAEVERFFDVAARVDPAISQATPAWARRKECLMRMGLEFLATYEAQVERGEA